jgi:site-specific recombinase XerD
MARQGVSDLVAVPQWIDPFVAQIHCRDQHRRKLRRAFLRFVHFLQQKRHMSAVEPQRVLALHADLVEAYLQRLREQRGLCLASLAVMRRPCQALMAFAAEEGIADLRLLRPETIHEFLARQAKQCNRQTMRSRCAVLRDFLADLHRRGKVAVNLAGAVLAPRVYRHEQCPRYLARAEIDAVLAVIDRQTPIGRRDYAMVLLLAVYGLRGIEVVHLRLDDLDWRRQLIHVRCRKAGNNTTYPLSVPVGEAILAYLRQDRPASAHREVFLTMVAPLTPFASSEGLANQVKKYLAKAGIGVEKPGTHSFRYSCAQRLFEVGTPLKTIGDYLGHRDTSTTQRYTMIALDQLREVATGDGEDLL